MHLDITKAYYLYSMSTFVKSNKNINQSICDRVKRGLTGGTKQKGSIAVIECVTDKSEHPLKN